MLLYDRKSMLLYTIQQVCKIYFIFNSSNLEKIGFDAGSGQRTIGNINQTIIF